MSDGGQRKAPSAKDNVNHDLCEFLMELSAYERNVTRNVFKSNAYRSAASALAAHPTRITGGKEASSIKGIGKKIAEKIDEFLATGKLKKLEKIRQDDASVALTELTRVTGVGPAKARQLYDAGVKDLDALRKKTDLLTHHQQIGLKYVDEFEKRIPRAEVEAIEAALRRSLACLPQDLVIIVCGSYRRGSEKSGDVDVLITCKGDKNEDVKPNIKLEDAESKPIQEAVKGRRKREREEEGSPASSPSKKLHCDAAGSSSSSGGKPGQRRLLQAAVEQLQDDGLVTDTLSLGDTKFMGVCRVPSGECHRRLDIRLLTPDQYYCGVLYFTGSDLFNKEMRSTALEAGFTLNEYSIRPVGSTGVPGEPLPVTSEQDIFDIIGMKYRAPKDRNM